MEYDFLITKEELEELLESRLRLTALENGGVDNWTWYGESIRTFLNENGVKHFSELVEEEISQYEVVF